MGWTTTPEDAATADQTGAEIKTAYEAEANAYDDTKDTKLTGMDADATDDQTAGEIDTLMGWTTTPEDAATARWRLR